MPHITYFSLTGRGAQVLVKLKFLLSFRTIGIALVFFEEQRKRDAT